MIRRQTVLYLAAALFLVAPLIALSQDAGQNQNPNTNLTQGQSQGPTQSQNSNQSPSLIINGQSDQPVPVVQMSGRSYADVEALAHALQGTLSFGRNHIALNLPGAAGGPANAANAGFSKAFLRAGIEEMGTLREWHTALASAIQNNFPVGQDWLSPFRQRAADNLRLVSIAASTDADRSGYQLLSNEMQNMSQLADKYLALRANLTYIAPDALQNDDLNSRIVACGHALGAMAGSGQFVFDSSCH
ncbi:MAG: hypothetical protein WAN72_15390 [Candidatus Acidiferrales bacterium]